MYWDNTIIFIKKLVQYFYKLLWQGKISLNILIQIICRTIGISKFALKEALIHEKSGE